MDTTGTGAAGGSTPPARRVTSARRLGHAPVGGFCGVCGVVWPCPTARRGATGGTAPHGIPLHDEVRARAARGAGDRRDERRRSGTGRAEPSSTTPDSPTALGYLRPRPGLARPVLAAGMAHLEEAACSQGWALGEVFVDDDPARPFLAWGSLLATAREGVPVAVLIPDVAGLRPAPEVQDTLRRRLLREVGAPLLLAASPADTWPERWR